MNSRFFCRAFSVFLFCSSAASTAAETVHAKDDPQYDLILSAEAGRVEMNHEWQWKRSLPVGFHVSLPEACARNRTDICAKAGGMILLPMENDSDASQKLRLLPASDLSAGLRFCPDRICRVSLGRSIAGFSDGARSALSHGPLTGLHVVWKDLDVGEIRLTPLHRPDLAGRFYDEGDPAAAGRFQPGRGPGGPETYGHDAAFTTRIGTWDFAGRLGTLRQKSTQSPYRRRDEDNLEYLGASVSWTESCGGWLLSAVFAGEKVAGSHATLNFDRAGSMRRRIDGFALESAFGAVGRGFSFEFRAFLPEPARTSQGSKPADTDTSGYVGFGESFLQAPILTGRFRFSPVPTLCGETANCTGITTTRGESGFQSHAAVLAARAGIEVSAFELLASVSLFRPVAYGPGERRPAKIGSDPSTPAFLEIGLEIRTVSSSRAVFTFGAGRVVRRAHAGQPTKLKGETYYVSVAYPF